MVKNIHFSVLIPVYKVEKYLERCVQSVLEQTYQEFDVVLVDDGSPDNCPALCDAYAARDSRLHVIHKENGGALSARCAAIDYACDELSYDRHYLLFLDADDTFKPNTLEVIADNIQSTGCDMLIFNADMTAGGAIIGPVKSKPFVGIITDSHEKLCMIANEQYNSLCMKAVHRDLFVRRDYRAYYHISVGEDAIQNIDIIYNAKRIVCIDDRLYNYEQNPNSITHQTGGIRHIYKSCFRTIICDFLLASPLWTEEDKRWYAKLTRSFMGREVRQIGYYACKNKEIFHMWDSLWADAYYHPFLKELNTGRYIDSVILGLFKYRLYVPLLLICKIRAKFLSMRGNINE